MLPGAHPLYLRHNSQETLSRLRTKSFPSLSTPFSYGDQEPGTMEPNLYDDVVEHTWSSNSPSEGDFPVDDQRYIHPPPED